MTDLTVEQLMLDASQLPGVTDLAQLILDKQVRLGRPGRVRGLAEATGGPAYAVAAGLLVYALAAEETMPQLAEDKRGEEPEGLLGRFGHWFREHF